MKNYKLFFAIILTACVLISGCSTKGEEAEPAEKINGRKYTVWITYWQTENIFKELDYRKDSIEGICYFGAYFNEGGDLFIPENIDKIYSQVQKGYGSYLTFVNDRLRSDGTSSLKDTDLLYELFSSEESMDTHIKDVISLAKEGGYQGIEIDYEGIREDTKLWELYVDFVEKLYQEMQNENIPLRIVLEPSTPVENLGFPEGPEYVIMCYNLYGYGTEPGPKADIKFLQGLTQKMSVLPGKLNFALATGGFDFREDGEVTQVTEIEATELFTIYDVKPIRDEDSGSMVFSYTDEDSSLHEVWYADEETIELWSDTIEKAGDYRISLWRIGGNLVH